MAEHAHPTQKAHPSHGNTVAAWTAVGILIGASLVMSVAVVLASTGLFMIGILVALVGVIAGKVLAMAGYGMPRPSDDKATRGVR